MILGTSVVIAILQREPSRQPFLLLLPNPDVVPVVGALARRAAQLNVGDCFAAPSPKGSTSPWLLPGATSAPLAVELGLE